MVAAAEPGESSPGDPDVDDPDVDDPDVDDPDADDPDPDDLDGEDLLEDELVDLDGGDDLDSGPGIDVDEYAEHSPGGDGDEFDDGDLDGGGPDGAVDATAFDDEEMIEEPVEAEEVREGEFVCRSCHMAKRETALADRERMLCRDCA